MSPSLPFPQTEPMSPSGRNLGVRVSGAAPLTSCGTPPWGTWRELLRALRASLLAPLLVTLPPSPRAQAEAPTVGLRASRRLHGIVPDPSSQPVSFPGSQYGLHGNSSVLMSVRGPQDVRDKGSGRWGRNPHPGTGGPRHMEEEGRGEASEGPSLAGRTDNLISPQRTRDQYLFYQHLSKPVGNNH